jgi:hypothetical protein
MMRHTDEKHYRGRVAGPRSFGMTAAPQIMAGLGVSGLATLLKLSKVTLPRGRFGG